MKIEEFTENMRTVVIPFRRFKSHYDVVPDCYTLRRTYAVYRHPDGNPDSKFIVCMDNWKDQLLFIKFAKNERKKKAVANALDFQFQYREDYRRSLAYRNKKGERKVNYNKTTSMDEL